MKCNFVCLISSALRLYHATCGTGPSAFSVQPGCAKRQQSSYEGGAVPRWSAICSLSKSLLSLLPVGFVVDRVAVAPDRVIVAVRARGAVGSCPLCRRPSRRIHSQYVRRLGDLPWQGRVGQLDLQVRHFRCPVPECPRRVFAERKFRSMVHHQQADRLDEWLAAAKGSALAGFADSLVRDLAAVRAALSLPWSTGPVEGGVGALRRSEGW